MPHQGMQSISHGTYKRSRYLGSERKNSIRKMKKVELRSRKGKKVFAQKRVSIKRREHF